MRDRFKRHQIQQSMTGDPAIFLCDYVAASLSKLGNFLLESLQGQFMRAGDEQAWSSRGFFLRRKQNRRVSGRASRINRLDMQTVV